MYCPEKSLKKRDLLNKISGKMVGENKAKIFLQAIVTKYDFDEVPCKSKEHVIKCKYLSDSLRLILLEKF